MTFMEDLFVLLSVPYRPWVLRQSQFLTSCDLRMTFTDGKILP